MKITTMRFYGGARDKVCRLGLANLFLELQQIIFDAIVNIEEAQYAKGGAAVREAIDAQFSEREEWKNTVTGGIDWVKRTKYNTSIITRMGVEVQVSARSDMVVRDLVHLRRELQDGTIDIGVIIVPSDGFQRFLPDRTPSLRETLRYIDEEFPEAKTCPLIVIAVENDGVGLALPKKKTNKGEGRKHGGV